MSAGPELPTPSFAVLVNQFFTQGMIELGEIKNPVTGEQNVAPLRALFTIRMLELLRHKTVGNLEKEELAHLDNALGELKARFDARRDR